MIEYVAISESALEAIRAETALANDGKETGGILLGHQDETFRVFVAGDPGPCAVRGTHSFLRDLPHSQRLATAAWEADRSQWIGEWHTHPTGPCQPSRADMHTYLELLRDPDLGFRAVLSLVVCLGHDRPSLTAWVVTESGAVGTPWGLAKGVGN